MKFWYKLKFFYHFLRALINPNDVRHSVNIGSTLCASGVVDYSVQHIKKNPNAEEFFKAPPLVFTQDMDFLSKCPEGSLGREYYLHLTMNNLDPKVFPKTPVTNDSTYVENLIRQVHDIWHVLTGFDVSLEGEIGLQAFKAKQMNWPFAMVAMGGVCLLTLLKTPQNIVKLTDEIARGWHLGSTAKPLILVNWNNYWTIPLKDVKSELQLP